MTARVFIFAAVLALLAIIGLALQDTDEGEHDWPAQWQRTNPIGGKP